jgi:type IV pilus assembly protein PilN
MAKINLLPWREELRQQRQQRFVTALVSAVVVSCLLFAFGYFYIEGLKEHQQRRNQIIQDEIKIVDRIIVEIKDIEHKKDQLLTKIEVIQDLQESRSQIVHLFDELSQRTPEGVFLTNFAQMGKQLTLTGRAKTNARISAYMRGIENSSWLEYPMLKEIKGKGKANTDQNKNFVMQARQKKPQAIKQNR